MGECVFCKIVAGRAPADFVLHPGQHPVVVGFAPLGPVVPGHVLFVPKDHVVDAAEDAYVTALTFRAAAAWATSRGGPFNLITSAGEAATQSVFHLHVHYVPRAVDDGLMVPWGTLHGEDPKAPHRCRRVVDLERQLAEARGW
jgi:histidine triad (HIT) family protein